MSPYFTCGSNSLPSQSRKSLTGAVLTCGRSQARQSLVLVLSYANCCDISVFKVQVLHNLGGSHVLIHRRKRHKAEVRMEKRGTKIPIIPL